jgi:Domain of unknown function (DUF4926)
MKENVQQYDVVALAEDLPQEGLVRGQVGTAIEPLAPGVFEVEFSDHQGITYAMLPLRTEQMIVLHHAPVQSGR